MPLQFAVLTDLAFIQHPAMSLRVCLETDYSADTNALARQEVPRFSACPTEPAPLYYLFRLLDV